MFSLQIFTRTLTAAALFGALIAASTQPIMAAPLATKAVTVEKIGDAKFIDDTAQPAPGTMLHLTFAVNSSAEANVAAYVRSQTDSTSPNYHKWLTPQEFGAKFGATSSDVNAVVQYLHANNFSNVKVWSNNLFITADTTRSQAEKAFGVTIHGYDHPTALVAQGFDKSYYAPDRNPTLNANVATRLRGLFGLSNALRRRPASLHKEALPAIASNGGLDPTDLSTAYDTAAMKAAGYNGQGITMAIVSPTLYLPSDVAAFFTAENITEPTINNISVDGGPVTIVAGTATTSTTTTGVAGTTTVTVGGVTTETVTTVTTAGTTTTVYTITPDYSGEDETDLDLEVAGGQAPQTIFNDYEGPNDGSFDIFDQIAQDDTAQIVTDSWGNFEVDPTVSQTYADSYDDIRAQMVAEGMTIFVATGDYAAYTTPGGTVASVCVDASSSYVTAVGGTDLTLGTGSTWAGETAWTYNDLNSVSTSLADLGSNGGLSIYYPIPTWQVGPGVYNTSTDGYRQVPDVAALAGAPGYDVYSTDPTAGTAAFGVIYGTSGSTPMWASGFDLIEEHLGARQGDINPNLYFYGENYNSAFHDITSGNNGLYTCTPGWDFVTGLGSADFGNLLSAYQGTLATSNTSTSPATYHTFPSGIQMITIPYSYAGTGLTSSEVLNGMVTSSGAPSFDIAAWDPLTSDYVLNPASPATVPIPGQAYWARFSSVLNGGQLLYAGTPVSSLTTGIGIAPGWNMVGDPYTSLTPIEISNLQFQTGTGTYTWQQAIADDLISPDLYSYNGSAYIANTTGGQMQPWEGYWIYSGVSAELLFTAP